MTVEPMPLGPGGWCLREFAEADVEALARHANNKKIWLQLRDRFPHPYRVKDAVAWVRACQTQVPPQTLAIADEEHLAGAIGFELQSDVHRRCAEIGYWVAEPFWGRGLATRALRVMTEHAFRHFDVLRLTAYVFEGNDASLRVLEKAGYTREGRLYQAVCKEGRILDLFVYGRLRDGGSAK
jgi:RimJ/RimL family protein N-acetyltransferase